MTEFLTKWALGLFRSSASSARLVMADKPYELPNGQSWRYCAIASTAKEVKRGNEYVAQGLVQGVSFTFALSKSKPCDIEYTVFIDANHLLYHITRDTLSQTEDGWDTHIDNYLLGVHELAEFQSAYEELRQVLKPIIGEKGVGIKNDHPLLNRFNSGGAAFYEKE